MLLAIGLAVALALIVIGTEFEVKVKGHETEPSNMNFKYENGDELVLTGGFIQKNLNANKSIYVEREIGRRPVLAFGNSGSAVPSRDERRVTASLRNSKKYGEKISPYFIF